ncbi:ATP-binding protein [Streptomyces griseofuscus]|uniref:ATP-binding protein n=1 Tax=Streptomyces griseofuscus TaxID=146922 RepID=UPI0033DA9A18
MAGGIADGMRHLRSEWGRWWRAEDVTDTHIAHRILNDQYRLWRTTRQQVRADVTQSVKLLQDQQRQQTYMQMQRMQAMRRSGGRGFYGYGFGGGSPIISYRIMQWRQLQMRVNSEEFKHLEVTNSMLQIGYGQLRARRHRAAFLWVLALLVLWSGLWWVSALAALAVAAAAGAVVLVMAWSQGRHPTRRRPPVPKLLFVPASVPAHTELEAPPEPEPFALREAGRDPRQVREAVRLALAKEGAKVAEVQLPEETTYGWKVPLVLESGTAEHLMSRLKNVATTLRVGASRVMAQASDPDDAALMAMRILVRDPFADPPPYPQRPPRSCSILNQVSLGISVEGETTPVVLAGQHVLLVANTGGGKSSLVQAIAEFVTACDDAVVVDIDPVKRRGLKALSPAAAMTARTMEEAEDVLEQLLARAQARTASMPPTQDTWIPTPDAPAIVAVIEEFPGLSKRAKELSISLLRLGRESLISIVLITQDATSAVLSDAIADAFPIRILMACRAADVPLAVGRPDAVSQGWLPHLLIPSPEPDFPADAGRYYCVTARHRSPILRYVTPLPPAEADRRTRERIAAGLPRLESAPAPAPAAADVPEIARLLLEAFATHSDPAELSVEDIGRYMATIEPDVWAQWDDRSTRDRRAQIGRHLKARLKEAGLAELGTVRIEKMPGRPSGYRLADIRALLEKPAA